MTRTIVEEYDKNGNLTKRTIKDEGDCMETKYVYSPTPPSYPVHPSYTSYPIYSWNNQWSWEDWCTDSCFDCTTSTGTTKCTPATFTTLENGTSEIIHSKTDR